MVAAATGSGYLPRRACRSVATWSMLTPSRMKPPPAPAARCEGTYPEIRGHHTQLGDQYGVPETELAGAGIDEPRPWGLRADRLLQLGGDPVGVGLDELLVGSFDQNTHLRLGAAVAHEHAAVLPEFLLHVADDAHHFGDGA